MKVFTLCLKLSCLSWEVCKSPFCRYPLAKSFNALYDHRCFTRYRKPHAIRSSIFHIWFVSFLLLPAQISCTDWMKWGEIALSFLLNKMDDQLEKHLDSVQLYGSVTQSKCQTVLWITTKIESVAPCPNMLSGNFITIISLYNQQISFRHSAYVSILVPQFMVLKKLQLCSK